MKKVIFKIVLVLVFLAGSNNMFSNIVSDTVMSTPSPDLEINEAEDLQTYYDKGMSYHNMHDFPSAEEAFLKAVEMAEKSNEKEILSNSFHYLGNIESWKSDFSQSICYHRKARDLFIELNNSAYVAISNNQIAFDYASLGEYDSALVYYQMNIQNRAFIEADDAVLSSYQGVAATYARLYNYKKAYRYLQEGIEYAEETGNKQSLGVIYFTAGNLFLNNHVSKDIALEYLLEAQSIFNEDYDYRYLNMVRLSIGDVYFKTGNDTMAMQLYEEVNTKLYPDDYAMHSRVDHKIAMVYKSWKDYDKALQYFQRSINGMCLICPEIQIHQTLIEAARTSLIIIDYDQALLYLNRAKNIAAESESGLEKAISFMELGSYYQAINKTDSAIYYLELAHHLETNLGLPKRVKKTAELLSEIYYSKGDFQTSSDYLKMASQMNDSMANIEKYNEVAKLEMRFEIEQKETEISKQKLLRNSFIGGAFLLVIIGLVLWRAYRHKKKDNQLLAEQKVEIQEISNKLQQSTKRKLDFFTNISHEIRTPLTLIKSPLERILNTNENNRETDNQLQMALRNTNKLKELVNQILDLQKLDEKLLGLDVSNFEIIAFCREIVASFEGYCCQSNCKLIFESNVSEALVSFDQIRLRSILINLLSNAFKYNIEGGFVHLNLEVNSSQVTFTIEDNGIGISEENLKRIGERYYQIEQTNASVEGTGIGLAYVKELVQLMNGSIEFSSIENMGTFVSITLACNTIKIQTEKPVLMEIVAKEKAFAKLEEQLSDNMDGLPRILIVEDNFELREFLRDLFAPSYQVICAKDGLEGKEMALKYIPDLIISDIMMPAIKGNELCKILKNNVNTSHITIILFTAKGAPESIVDGYDCGADDYIVKPFETDLLVKKVKNIIATGENARKQFSFTDIDRSTSVYSEFDKKFLKDCMSFIKDNLDSSNFTVELLSEKMNVHRRTLLRKFNALTGKSPVDLIRHNRMSKAAELIKQNYRVNEVALMVGYEDTNRFSQAFKQFHGVSPSTYY